MLVTLRSFICELEIFVIVTFVEVYLVFKEPRKGVVAREKLLGDLKRESINM